MIIDEEVYLEHHGVKGMKWGVRKKYVPKDRRSSGKKDTQYAYKGEKQSEAAKKYESKAKANQTRINALKKSTKISAPSLKDMAKDRSLITKENVKNKVKQTAAKTETAARTKMRDQDKKDAQAKKEGRLTSRQKTAMAGAALAVTAIAAYGGYRMVQSGQMNVPIMKGKQFLEKRDGPFKKNPVLANKNMNPQEIQAIVVQHINPGYYDDRRGTNLNCRRNTFAYEMRRRGYDVSSTRTSTRAGQSQLGFYRATSPGDNASKLSLIGRLKKQELLGDGDGNERLNKVLSTSLLGENTVPHKQGVLHSGSIFDALREKMPDGARGEVTVAWKSGGGHSMAWEIVNGEPVIFDGMTGKMYKSGSEELGKLIFEAKDAGFTRLDNLDMNPEFLMRWLKDSESSFYA